MKALLPKADRLLLAALLLLALGWGLYRFACKAPGSQVVVYQDGQVAASWPLTQNRQLVLEHNIIQSEDGRVFMEWAECPDQICVKTGRIIVSGDMITCLPNRVIVRIEATGTTGGGVDVVAK